LRALTTHIGALLPNPPLPGAARYREEHLASIRGGPLKAYSELDGAGRDLRRIEVYADGGMDYAVRTIETGTTRLLRERVPPRGAPITPARFEELWQIALQQAVPRGPIRVVEDPAA